MQPFVIVALAALINFVPLRLTTLAYAGAVVLVVPIGQCMRVRRERTVSGGGQGVDRAKLSPCLLVDPRRPGPWRCSLPNG